MTSQEFFWTSAVVAVGLAAFFLYPRPQRAPSRLRLLRGQSLKNQPVPMRPRPEVLSEETLRAMGDEPDVKILNVMFNYNGHSWDAHEVLGVPPGAAFEMVRTAFEKSMRASDPSSHDFIRTAYQAIESQVGRRAR